MIGKMGKIPPKDYFSAKLKSDIIEKELSKKSTHIDLSSIQFNEWEYFKELDIQHKVWFKLFKLQNYKLSENLFSATGLSSGTLRTYLSRIRTYTKNADKSVTLKAFESIVFFTRNLVKLGVSPFPTPNNKLLDDSNLPEINVLVESGILNAIELDFVTNMLVKEKKMTPYEIVCSNYMKDLSSWRHKVPSFSENTLKAYINVCKRLKTGEPIYIKNKSLCMAFDKIHGTKTVKEIESKVTDKVTETIEKPSNIDIKLSGSVSNSSFGLIKGSNVIFESLSEDYINGYIHALRDSKVDLNAYKKIKISNLL